MKLHLPKPLLLAAIAAVAVAPAFAADYTVGTITEKQSFPSNSGNIVSFDGSADGTDDGVFTLSGSDWLGAKDGNGNKLTSFGTMTWSYTGFIGIGKWSNTSTGTVTQNAKFENLRLEGSAQIVLGGQYKCTNVVLGTTAGDYAEYAGIIANKVEVTDNATITSYNAQVGSLVAKGGTVKIHTSAYQGNTGMRINGAVDSKQVQIHNLLKVSGTANVSIGATTKDGSLLDGHVATAFGSFTYTGDPSIEEGDESTNVDDYVTNVTDYNIHSSHIVQEDGTLNVAGKSLSIGGLNIDQTGGKMSISTGINRLTEDGVVKAEVPMCHFLADYGDSQIEQNGDADTVLSIGLIKAYNVHYNNVVKSLKMNGMEVDDIDPMIAVTQYGAGTINLNGVYFFNQETGAASADVSTIVQADHVDEVTGAVTATTGTINLAGAYEGATFDITQRAAGGTISLSGTMSAGTVNQTAGTLSVNSSGAMTVDSMSVGGTVTNDGTIEGQITVNGGTLVNKGLIGQAPLNPSSEEGADVAALSTTDDMLVTIASGEVQNYGTITQDISVKGGTLTLEQGAQVLGVALEAGNINVIGSDVTTGALTLNGGTITFMEGATITLADGANVTIDGATIVVNVSDAALADLKNGAQYTLFNTTSDVTAIEGTTMTFVATGSGEQVEAVVSHEGAGNLSIATIVPEPTTATLSLLALAALAARRRRK